MILGISGLQALQAKFKIASGPALKPLLATFDTNVSCEGRFDAILVDSTDMGMAQGRTGLS